MAEDKINAQEQGAEEVKSKKEKKAEKAAAKQAKKEEKQRKQNEKREQKLIKSGMSPEEAKRMVEQNAEYEEGGSKLAVFFVTIIIVAIWLAILALLIKMDVGGFGSTLLRPILKDVPYVNKILPEAEAEEMAESENTEYPYGTIEEAITRIKELEVALQEEKNAGVDKDARIKELEEQAALLGKYKENEALFEERKQKFDEAVVFSDEAPDINEYRKYYEEIDPANAEAIYKRVVEQQESEAELKNYISMYSEMKPKQAAAIFDTMTNDLNLVAKILKGMGADSSSRILGAMNAETAAKLTKLMEPDK